MIRPYNRAEVHFDLIREIGTDGRNSKAYVAHDHQLDAEIVVKEVKKASLNSSADFFGESKLLYASAHPNVVQIHYACQDSDAIYLAMPYYRKGSVKGLMNTRALSVREIVTLGCQMLSGLHNIHSKRLVHFDIKPDNILLSDRGEALLSDFGLARRMNLRGVAEQDRFYVRMIPPEGMAGHEHDVTFDIYQVGLTLYRMCNGNVDFEAQFAAFGGATFDRDGFRFAVRNGRFPKRADFLPHVPNRLRRIVQKCLETDPTKRFQTALEVSNALAEVDGATLDWYFSRTGDTREWRKNENGTSYEFTVDGSGSSQCYKAVNGGARRRVSAGCNANMNERAIQKFLGET